MWTRNQEQIIRANGGAFICGVPALAANGLSWWSSLIAGWTMFPSIHRLRLGDFYWSHYHLDDDAYIVNVDPELNVYKPTAERALIDAMVFMEQSYDEGVAIEAMQNYIRKNMDNFAELYRVADHYSVDHGLVAYWLNEAREESDMSMG